MQGSPSPTPRQGAAFRGRAGRWAGRALMVLLPLCVLLLTLSAAAGQAAAQAPPTHILINELLAKSLSGLTGADGAPCEWVELYNPTDWDIDLTGWGLSDKKNQPYRFSFPNCTLAAGAYLVVYLDGAADTASPAEGLHAAFRLDGSGGHLYLTDADGERVDSLAYPEQSWDVPYGRLAGEWERLGCFSAATPGAANPMRFWGGEKAYADSADVVEFSVPAGCYDQEFTLYLSTPDPDALIVYTLDGSDPDLHSSVYTAAGIPIQSRAGEPNRYVTVAQSDQFPSSLYQNGANEVYKGRVVRARLYKDGQLGAEIFTASYFIRPETSLPILSLVSDPEGLFDAQDGLTMQGPLYWAALLGGSASLDSGLTASDFSNYSAAQQVSGSLEQFSAEGELLQSQRCTLRLAGNGARSAAVKKSLIVSLEDGATLKLRGQGSNEAFQECMIDAMWNNYLVQQDIGAASNDLVALFLDGEYWGIYARQQTATALVEQRSGLDRDALYMVKADPNAAFPDHSDLLAQAGGQEALDAYLDFYQELLTRDFAQAQDLAWLETQLDLDELIRYVLAELFVGNQDWISYGYNITLWRSAEASGASDASDGRWRFLLYDLDSSTGNNYGALSYGNAAANHLQELLGIPEGAMAPAEGDTPALYWVQTPESIQEAAEGGPTRLLTLLFRKLWCSQQFRDRFTQEAFAECQNGGLFVPERVLAMLEDHRQALLPEIEADLARLEAPLKLPFSLFMRPDTGTANVTLEHWQDGFDYMHRFLAERAQYLLDFIWLAQTHDAG